MEHITKNCEIYLDDFTNYIKDLINIFIIYSFSPILDNPSSNNYETDMLC